MSWQQLDDIWISRPSNPKALLQFIGGSGLGATPQLSYRRLLEALTKQGWLVHCWPFVPNFDHQFLAVEAWRSFRKIQQKQEIKLPCLRVGHSMGCKLHLLAPDQGRGCKGQVHMSFNNFSAERSIPFFSELAPRFGIVSEFSPAPAETLEIISKILGPKQQLIIKFRDDQLDQSQILYSCLKNLDNSSVKQLELAGDHLTPASAGLRQQFFGGITDGARQRELNRLAVSITEWWNSQASLRN